MEKLDTKDIILPIAREGALCFRHDTHRLVVLETFAWNKKMVTWGRWHYNTTYHPIDAKCENCSFSKNNGTICTIKMSVQIDCANLLNSCGYMSSSCQGNDGEICNSGGKWIRVDGKYWIDGYLEKIFPIIRDPEDIQWVPPWGLCHVYKKRI